MKNKKSPIYIYSVLLVSILLFFSCSLSKNLSLNSFSITLPRVLVSDDSIAENGLFAQCKITQIGANKVFTQTHSIEDRTKPITFEFSELVIGKKYNIVICVYLDGAIIYQGIQNEFLLKEKEQTIDIQLIEYKEPIIASTLPDDFVFVEGSVIKASTDEYNQTGNTSSSADYFFIKDREVTISDFYICKHEVTQKEYNDIMGAKTGDKAPNETYGIGDNLPMYYVSWFDAIAYCNKRSELEGLDKCYYATVDGEQTFNINDWGDVPTSQNDSSFSIWKTIKCDFTKNGYRLPTEAEWEYAARGGKEMSTLQYAGASTLSAVAWYLENSTGCVQTVMQKTANSLLLYDMSGNVCEWCYDYKNKKNISTSTENPVETYNDVGKIIRGGDYTKDSYNQNKCSVAFRTYTQSHYSDNTTGFRLVRTY